MTAEGGSGGGGGGGVGGGGVGVGGGGGAMMYRDHDLLNIRCLEAPEHQEQLRAACLHHEHHSAVCKAMPAPHQHLCSLQHVTITSDDVIMMLMLCCF